MATVLLVAAACGDSGTGSTAIPAAPTTATPAAPTTTTPAATTSVPPSTTTTTTTTTPAATTSVPPSTTTTNLPTPAPPEWLQLGTSNDPPARANPVFVVDVETRSAYLHAGGARGATRSDLWRLDLATGGWTELTPATEGPAPRFSHAGVWDERRGRLVIFAGEGQRFGDFFSDVWAYDPRTNEWTELAPGGAGPADRYGTCAGYDRAGDRFIISHGFTNDGRFDDTWAYSLADDTWTDITPPDARPGERCLHACAYDPTARALVLFGGQDDDVPFLGDTWVLQDGAWTELAGTSPSPRKFPAMAATGRGIVLVGGIGAEGRGNDTWLLDDPEWTQLTSTFPTARESHGAAYDPSAGALYIFGGTGDEGPLADTWVLASM